MVIESAVVEWLLQGDTSIQYRVRRELLNEAEEDLYDLRSRIPKEGWGKVILDEQKADGDWGDRYYQPKWISTHYTLMELMHMALPPETPGPVRAVKRSLERYLSSDGAFTCFGEPTSTDDCVSGMFLGAASYFGADPEDLEPLADHLAARIMNDGGWNCRSARSGAIHSSVHTTISCLEGFHRFRRVHPTYRSEDLGLIVRQAEEFLLDHHLCFSHRSGDVMDKKMLMLSWPSRWKFDVLRGLEYFADAGHGPDERLRPALKIIREKRRKDGLWPVQNRHPGAVHVQMEKTGGPSRWNTFRALKVLKTLS